LPALQDRLDQLGTQKGKVDEAPDIATGDAVALLSSACPAGPSPEFALGFRELPAGFVGGAREFGAWLRLGLGDPPRGTVRLHSEFRMPGQLGLDLLGR
jgi:hypothetical protein